MYELYCTSYMSLVTMKIRSRSPKSYHFLSLTNYVRDLFHVYLNKCEYHFSRLHVNKINNFCFLLNNGRVPCMTK